MPRPRHYSPAIDRFLVSVLYHEARRQNIPMTRLANGILKRSLHGSAGWKTAEEQRQLPKKPIPCTTQ
ncbi:MAG TPA: hypothetical protein VI454_14745 [Verrucomicrobiae bacterium]